VGKPNAEAQVLASLLDIHLEWVHAWRRCRFSWSGLGLRAAVCLGLLAHANRQVSCESVLFGAPALCLFAHEVKVSGHGTCQPRQIPSADGWATSEIGQCFETKISHSSVACLPYLNDARVLVMPQQTSIPFSVYGLTPVRATATVDRTHRTF